MTKVYFEFKTLPANEIVDYFIPSKIGKQDYQNNIGKWDSRIESGMCLGLKKVLRSDQYVNYMHVKYKPDINAPKPKLNKLLFLSKETGISFEYAGDRRIVKDYFYFKTDLEKKFLSSKFKLDESVSHFEYTEIGDTFKIINVYDGKNEIVLNILRKKNISCLNAILNFFIEEYNIMPCFYGEYENNTISVYWSFTFDREKLKALL